MNSTQLFNLALGLNKPWYIERIELKEVKTGKHTLNIHINFNKGAKFPDHTGKECPVYDTKRKTWRHLDFFQHECYLHARVPRIETSQSKIQLIDVPWARTNCGFTLLFEAFTMSLIENEMPINKVSNIIRVNPNRIWNVFKYWIKLAFKNDDQTNIRMIGIDETSKTKGHNYVTLAADLDAKRVVFVCEGKDEATIKQLKSHFESKDVKPEQIEQISIDMSPAFIKGVNTHFPDSHIVFDRFHIVKKLNEAMDEVRKSERRKHDALKGHKYTFLKKNKNLTQQQKIDKYELSQDYPILGDACRLQELFNDFWDFRDREQAESFLAYWCDLVDETDIKPFIKFTNTIKNHWDGITNYFQSQISNGILEGINSKIQLAKRRARGYRNVDNFIAMIYFIAGKLEFDYPLIST